jgi:hypothetical protein
MYIDAMRRLRMADVGRRERRRAAREERAT